MVQYIITPWRNRQQLLEARDALYPTVQSDATYKVRSSAVALVSVWVQRGNCPHLIESTALLVSAVLNDRPDNPIYATRAAYSSAFCRFVTGLLDGYQDAKRKLSMYSIAKNIGLPASFVELRHQCTHEELPSLLKLRGASEKSLSWIWDHYWRDLKADIVPEANESQECRLVLKEYMQWRAEGRPQDQKMRKEFARRVKKFESGQILETLMDLGDAKNAKFLLESTRLAAAIVSGEEDLFTSSSLEEPAPAKTSLDDLRAEMAVQRRALEAEQQHESDESASESDLVTEDEDGDASHGWEAWKGPWVSKPIGIN